jgi:hypothetical protein
VIVVLVLGVLIAWVLLSALAILSYRGTLMVLDRYGPWPALAFASAQAALLLIALAW